MSATCEDRELLALRFATPPAWAARAAAEPLALLADHAHCELQAAAAAQSLLVRNAGRPGIAPKLSAHAIEELRHFRRVHRVLCRLGGELGPAEPNPYAAGLLRAAGPTCGPASLDRLLVAGFIEARSHERFALLADAPWPADAAFVAELYRGLLASEAGHARLFAELALALHPRAAVQRRAEELARLEAELVAGLPFAPRVHSGPAGR